MSNLRLNLALPLCRRCVTYHGRATSSSPATGNMVQHKKEFKAFMDSIFGELTQENKARLERIVKEQQAKSKADTKSSPPGKSGSPSKKRSSPASADKGEPPAPVA